MLQVAAFARVSVGSIATSLGSSSATFESRVTDGTTDVFDLSIPFGTETGTVNFGQIAGVGLVLNSDNENAGAGNMFVDVANQTTSGFFFTARLGEPDFISWSSVPFGTRLIDHPATVSNHADANSFADQFIAVTSFSLETDASGAQLLRGTASYTCLLYTSPSPRDRG